MIRLYQAENLLEAYLLLHMLEQRRIPAKVLNENLHGAVGEIPFVQAWPEIWLEDERDLSLARGIVTEFEQRPRSGAERVCLHCGETNPGTFETCWQCGESLDPGSGPTS